MDKGRLLMALWVLFVVLPLWLFLVYSMLKAGNYDRLVWFAFFVYCPAIVIGAILSAVFGD